VTRLIAAILSLTLGLAAAFALVSCGSGDKSLLPGDTADEIESNLSSVQEQAAAGDCEGAQASAAEVSQQVDELGPEVDRQLRAALAEGAAQVESVVAACTPTETTEITTDTEFTDTEPTETTESETTETTESEPTETTETTEPTTTETTTSEPTTSTPPPPPPSDGGGDIDEGGGGNSGGGSGGIGPGGKSGLDG
jgi:hypothetical protein